MDSWFYSKYKNLNEAFKKGSDGEHIFKNQIEYIAYLKRYAELRNISKDEIVADWNKYINAVIKKYSSPVQIKLNKNAKN